MFLLKKLISPLFFPFSLCVEILIVGLLLLLFFSGKQRFAKSLLVLGFLLLFIFSFEPLADRILSPLEYRYPPLSDAQIARQSDTKWIVVLGGGSRSDARLPATTQLSSSSLARLAEGIRLHRMLPHSKLILSGGAVFDKLSNAEVMANAASLLGVPAGPLVLETGSRDTAEQAIEVKKIVGSEPFFLVTSASHLPRSMGLFQKQGLKPIPAPADYFIKDAALTSPARYYPGPAGLAKSERALYEYIGILWGTLSGKL